MKEDILISVLDAPVGLGKTTAIFKWMLDNPNRKYLYISPMLSEVEERVPKELESLEFVYPTQEKDPKTKEYSKSYSLLKLLRSGCNTTFSHSLFTQMTQEHLDLIKEVGYTLIIDEEVDFIEAYNGKYTKGDMLTLLNSGWIKIDKDNFNKVEWVYEGIEDHSQYSDLKAMCDIGQLYCVPRSVEMLITQIPLSLLTHSKENILITYLFENSLMHSYLKMRGVKFNNLMDVYPDIKLLDSEEGWKEQVKNLIEIKTLPTGNRVKEDKTITLTSTWYSRNSTEEKRALVKKALRGIFDKHGSDNIIFTLPKSSVDDKEVLHTTQGEKINRKNTRKVTDSRIPSSSFLYTGARATNNYINKSVAVHAYNRYPNTVIKAYIQDYGGFVVDDSFALSELVQWVWRTRIRIGEPITIYFLSKRMEKLFIDWLNK